ncbi:hypothetical protein C1645_826764 [Glomus cerebriforme]|uniref:Uncharacterized protein n=1 Tax=Glomus cerebriforme TaxID=658196 RepID=A0A397SQ87_9GLOM|nr:hypothetical protein C1645_826764 [Glomus cerebriforme]
MLSNADQENVKNKIQTEEDFTYPLDNNIIYRECMNKITKHSFNYIIIKEGVYPNGIALNKKYTLETSNEITKYERSGTKAKISGLILFGLQLDIVQKTRESRKRENLIKPAINCIPSTLEKHAKNLATKIQSNFKNDVKGIYHQSD